MRNFKLVHLLDSLENLLHEVLDVIHGYNCIVLLALSECVFQATIAKFHDSVLNNSALGVSGIKEV